MSHPPAPLSRVAFHLRAAERAKAPKTILAHVRHAQRALADHRDRIPPLRRRARTGSIGRLGSIAP